MALSYSYIPTTHKYKILYILQGFVLNECHLMCNLASRYEERTRNWNEPVAEGTPSAGT